MPTGITGMSQDFVYFDEGPDDYDPSDDYDHALEAANQPPPPRYHVPDGYVALPGDPF